LLLANVERVTVEIREPHGDRRHSDPVSGLLKLPRPVPAGTKFRLLRNGKPVLAQFRPSRPDGKCAEWWLDFMVGMAPHEVQRYVVEYGADVEPGPELPHGHKLSEKPEAFVVANAPSIAWTVPRDLKGFLRSVTYPPPENLRPDSPGLVLRDRDGQVYPVGGAGTTARVIRQGPMAVELRFERAETHEKLAGVRWTADLLFPVPVSWVEVTWSLRDPNRRVSGMGIQVRLKLKQPTASAPTIVDLGASRTVYTTLERDEQVELRAAPFGVGKEPSDYSSYPWKVFRGLPDRLEPFVFAPLRSATEAEGWVQVMDRKRCLALAVGEFGKGEGCIHVSAAGTVSAWKTIATRPSGCATDARSFRAWLHFVEYPPQYGALSSPQSMMHPIELRVVQTP
jgi:hypothetical protein